MATKATVIYDADCGFCRWSLAVLLRLDRLGIDRSGAERGRLSPPHLLDRWGRSAAPGALRALALGTAEADGLLADLSPDERAASWHVVFDAGVSPTPAQPTGATPPTVDGPPLRLGAGAALGPTLALLPGGRVPASVFARFPRLTERGYRWVADHRSLLGRFVPGRARRWADEVIARSPYP
jgi:hypothetical protein